MENFSPDDPNCIQIEFTEGCNLRCQFCGINGIRTKKRDFRYMTPDVAEKLAVDIAMAGWNSRLEFAMHGEPTLNPHFDENMEFFEKYLPGNHKLLTTNGIKLRQVDLAPFNVVAIDCYESSRNLWEPLVEELDGQWYPDVKEMNPHRRRKIYEQDIVFVRDISTQTRGTHASLSNHCGAGGPLDDSRSSARCTLPFREIAVRYNGKIALCCNDWRGEYETGDVKTTNIQDIWNGERFDAARREIYHNGRTFRPCEGCNYRATRVGLLPDKLGKKEMPEPNDSTDAILREERDPLAPVVRREWE